MQKALDVIPRASYELIAYFVPGAFALFGMKMALLTGWQIDIFSSLKVALAESEIYYIILIVLASYVTGRALYTIADLTIKPLVKKCFGDPDKYLPLHNKALLKRWVKDYKPYFKEALQSRMTNIFGIAQEQLADVPYFKLCVEWVELYSPQQATLLKQRHTIEIFARNMATASLVVACTFWSAGNASATTVGFISSIIFLYYYYVRQIMRARSVYETFFALTGSQRPTFRNESKELQSERKQPKS